MRGATQDLLLLWPLCRRHQIFNRATTQINNHKMLRPQAGPPTFQALCRLFQNFSKLHLPKCQVVLNQVSNNKVRLVVPRQLAQLVVLNNPQIIPHMDNRV
jgi:hypothetical protein